MSCTAPDRRPLRRRGGGVAFLLLVSCVACARSGAEAEGVTAASDPWAAPEPVTDGPGSEGEEPCDTGRLVLELSVATLPWDALPPPTDMNGFIFEVADATILSDPIGRSWWEGPADVPFVCSAQDSPQAPCRVTLGPLDVDGRAAPGPLLVRARPTSVASPWATVITALPVAEPDDGNRLAATVFVMSKITHNGLPFGDAPGQDQDPRAHQAGVLALMADANGQLPAGARLALLDPFRNGPDPHEALAHGLRAPGWGTVDLYYRSLDWGWDQVWSESAVSQAVFATTSMDPATPVLPAAWLAVKDGEVPRVSDIVPLDLAAGNLVVLPLTLR